MISHRYNPRLPVAIACFPCLQPAPGGLFSSVSGLGTLVVT
ncbi:MAG TPA: hypothetical protein VGY97_11395 [Solirubrobacteraceae bacterium]|nr:hypothetical protein [Solirubrobacteraceae bacterium]